MKNPKQVAEFYLTVGENKVNTPFIKTLLLGIMAGMFIAFGGIGSTFGNYYVNNVVGAMIFPGGLAMVLIAGSELFTGNCLLILPLTAKKIKLKAVIKNLCTVYLGNLIGAVIVALIAVYSGALDKVSSSVITVATNKANLNFFQAILKGVLCNILVCIAVWMSFSAETVGGKILVIFFPITMFVVAGFEHSVANMYYLPAGLFEGIKQGVSSEGLNVVNCIFKNLVPVSIGNIIGGFTVGLVYKKVYLDN